MLSPETIAKIQKLSAEQQSSLIKQLDSHTLHADLVVKAEGVSLVDLEEFKEYRDNMRGSYSTDSIAEFHSFCKEQLAAFPSYPVFVNGPHMKATAIIDYGNSTAPGHCRFNASVKLERTALYNKLLNDLSNERFSQRELAETLEEYASHVQVFVEGAEGKEVAPLPKALAAIRKMSVDKVRNQSSEQNDYSAAASVMERVDIQAEGLRPVAFSFTCKPYTDLQERTFLLRISPITGRDALGFGLKVLKLEEIQEEIALEFKDKLIEGFADTEVKTFIGNYSPSN